MDAPRLIAIVTPLVAVQVMLIAIAIPDLRLPQRRVRGPNKLIWGILIVFVEVLGPVLYFWAGREPE